MVLGDNPDFEYGVTYDYRDGQLVKLNKLGVVTESWSIANAPLRFIRNAVQWNDANGDYDEMSIDDLRTVATMQFVDNQ
jgi:hypothetical protein